MMSTHELTSIDSAAVQRVPARVARRHHCIPVRMNPPVIDLAMADPLDLNALRDIEFATGMRVNPLPATREAILAALDRHYTSAPDVGTALSSADEPEDLRIAAGDLEDVDRSLEAAPDGAVAPAVKACGLMLAEAVRRGASDIHVEPLRHSVQVRFRVDGVLRTEFELPRQMHGAMLSRVKVLSKIDIAERRVPQDGRMHVRAHGEERDIRVSTLPTQLGEKAVLRLLESDRIPSVSVLGADRPRHEAMLAALRQPQGMILVTGPTGSGKTTTLYSLLEHRRSEGISIVTIEDPVEYRLAGASQVQVHGRSGLTFPRGLRAILRQDPDVILVGEIRDAETAEIAAQAAMTGHLVLSTLHTNSATAAVMRMLDLKVEPMVLASSLSVVVAQRLVRRVCRTCREHYAPAAALLRRIGVDRDGGYSRGRGCAVCAGTGYHGRVGVFDVMRVTPPIRELIQQRASEQCLREAALEQVTARGLVSDAARLVRSGATTAEEVARVLQLEGDAHEEAWGRE